MTPSPVAEMSPPMNFGAFGPFAYLLMRNCIQLEVKSLGSGHAAPQSRSTLLPKPHSRLHLPWRHLGTYWLDMGGPESSSRVMRWALGGTLRAMRSAVSPAPKPPALEPVRS